MNLTTGENGMSYHDKITLEDLSIEVEDIEELESGDADRKSTRLNSSH